MLCIQKRSFSISTILLLILLTGCSTAPVNEKQNTASDPRSDTVVTLDHKYFKIIYDTEMRLARYVVYQLTAEQLKQKKVARKNKFRPDPLLVKSQLPHVKPNEYSRTGYDRGHLAPSADFSWSREANDLTFVMSNMSPQTPNLNRDSWKKLEAKVRRWACGEEVVTVITGPVLRSGLPKLKSGLVIPQEFFKIVIDETPPKKVISFLYHQNDRGDVLAEKDDHR